MCRWVLLEAGARAGPGRRGQRQTCTHLGSYGEGLGTNVARAMGLAWAGGKTGGRSWCEWVERQRSGKHWETESADRAVGKVGDPWA